ncbi:DNA recombination protein RmuC, partial [uncultured Duncaniella sp.]|uniref:DNA recombination protein RmuC n=1 Tax=uncultured Duncaniella sp. TaxID=2768039 RepID=UPI0025A5698C
MVISIVFALAMTVIAAIEFLYLRKSLLKINELNAENMRLQLESEKARAEVQSSIASLTASLTESRKNCDSLTERLNISTDQLASSREENSSLHTRLELLDKEISRREDEAIKQEEKRREQEALLESRFKNLANDILRQNTADLKTQNEERLSEILAPLRMNIDEFRKTVSDTYNNEARERFSLSERIKELVDLNQSISRQARELSEALRGDSKVQGDWGEMVLETILEKSGLQEGEEYFMQVTNDQCGSALRNEA